MDDTNANHGSELTNEPIFLSCVERTPSAEFAEAAALAAIEANPQNLVRSNSIRSPEDGDVKLALAMSIPRQWKAGRTLKVSFMDPTKVHPDVLAKVKEYANMWTEHANITFDFNAPHPATIRVAFVLGDGHESCVGTDCLAVNRSKPTMNLDPTEINLEKLKSDAARFRQIVLHEFGHVLGCIHEHQQPNSPIKWNKANVRAKYTSYPYNWTVEKVDRNIIDRFEDRIKATQYDECSVMEYFFDSWMTENGYKVLGGTNLSGRDKDFIADMYPFPSSLDTGVVRYVKNAASRVATAFDSIFRHSRITVPLASPRSSAIVGAPSVLLGINSVNAAHDAALRIECELVEVVKDSVTIELRSGGDDSQETTGCAWFKIPEQEKDLQFGHVRISPKGPNSLYLTQHTPQKVTFKQPYQNIPKVIVWLHAIDCDADSSCNFDLVASDVTKKGFTLHSYSQAPTKLRLLGATWLAHSADRVDISTGSFSTQDISAPASEEPAALNSGVQPFEGAEFARLPKVFLAFSQLAIAREGDARVLVSYGNITEKEMTWNISGYDKTVLECARVSYIALEPVD